MNNLSRNFDIFPKMIDLIWLFSQESISSTLLSYFNLSDILNIKCVCRFFHYFPFPSSFVANIINKYVASIKNDHFREIFHYYLSIKNNIVTLIDISSTCATIKQRGEIYSQILSHVSRHKWGIRIKEIRMCKRLIFLYKSWSNLQNSFIEIRKNGEKYLMCVKRTNLDHLATNRYMISHEKYIETIKTLLFSASNFILIGRSCEHVINIQINELEID